MIDSPILKEKYNTQKRLNKKANDNLQSYYENSQRNVSDMVKKYGLKLSYSEKKGGYLKPINEGIIP